MQTNLFSEKFVLIRFLFISRPWVYYKNDRSVRSQKIWKIWLFKAYSELYATFVLKWGTETAATLLGGCIYCVIFAFLPCLPPFAQYFIVRDFFLEPRDCSIVSWIFAKNLFFDFLFLRPKKNDFLHFPHAPWLLFLLFYSSMWWSNFLKLYSSREKVIIKGRLTKKNTTTEGGGLLEGYLYCFFHVKCESWENDI